jgi:hypothetical protein
MHIKKNVFENIFNTVINVKEEIKDNIKARMNIDLFCHCKNMELVYVRSRVAKPKASFVLNNNAQLLIYQWLKSLHFSNVFVFAKQCHQVYYTYIPSFNKFIRVDWLSIVKTKLKDHVEAVQDENNELIVGDDVFQLGELVNPYRIALSNDLEENSNFHITDNIFVDVDAEELNGVLSSIKHTQVKEDDDSDKINVEDCNGDEDKSIDEEEDNYG